MIMYLSASTLTYADVYEKVWLQVRRFTSLPKVNGDIFNSDEEMFPPFTLKRVNGDGGLCCSQCSWNKACTGCVLEYSEEPVENIKLRKHSHRLEQWIFRTLF
eukprot:UN05683